MHSERQHVPAIPPEAGHAVLVGAPTEEVHVFPGLQAELKILLHRRAQGGGQKAPTEEVQAMGNNTWHKRVYQLAEKDRKEQPRKEQTSSQGLHTNEKTM